MSSKQRPKEDEILPPGWNRGFSRSQQRYFWSHSATKTSQWHPPTKEEARDPKRAKKAAELKAKEEGSKARKRERSNGSHSPKKSRKVSAESKKDTLLLDSANVAIIVPYRDLHPEQNRAEHLSKFLPHMHTFLGKQVEAGALSGYHIYIVDQSDDGRKFNRGKLLNIGFDCAKKHDTKHDVFIFHDVDLLPSDDLASWYSRFPKIPVHIARVWGRYSNNPKYFGGVVSFSASDMKRINGYPNTFWGWGGEDDEMQKRCEKLRIRWEYPPKGTLTDLEQMSIKQKIGFLRSHKAWKCQAKWEALDEHNSTWKSNGLSDLDYSIISKTSLDEQNQNATKITVDVKLNGNHWSNDKVALDYIGY